MNQDVIGNVLSASSYYNSYEEYEESFAPTLRTVVSRSWFAMVDEIHQEIPHDDRTAVLVDGVLFRVRAYDKALNDPFSQFEKEELFTFFHTIEGGVESLKQRETRALLYDLGIRFVVIPGKHTFEFPVAYEAYDNEPVTIIDMLDVS